jgi:hypothetical protein
MKRRVVALLLVLIFCLAVLPSAAYAQTPGSVCQREAKYDPAANLTTVECALLETFTPPIRLMLTANVAYQGKQPNETAKFHFNLSAFRGDSDRRTPPLFKEATTLSLSLETTRLEIPVTGFHADFFEMNRLLAEQAQASLDGENLRKLLEAKSLAGKWGNAEFKLTDASFQSLKKFISDQIFLMGER